MADTLRIAAHSEHVNETSNLVIVLVDIWK